MASLDFDATDAPRGLRAVLGLADNDAFTLENLSPNVRLKVREAATTPAATARGHFIAPGQVRTIRIRAGMDIYVWASRRGKGAPCILTPPV